MTTLVFLEIFYKISNMSGELFNGSQFKIEGGEIVLPVQRAVLPGQVDFRDTDQRNAYVDESREIALELAAGGEIIDLPNCEYDLLSLPLRPHLPTHVRYVQVIEAHPDDEDAGPQGTYAAEVMNAFVSKEELAELGLTTEDDNTYVRITVATMGPTGRNDQGLSENDLPVARMREVAESCYHLGVHELSTPVPKGYTLADVKRVLGNTKGNLRPEERVGMPEWLWGDTVQCRKLGMALATVGFGDKRKVPANVLYSHAAPIYDGHVDHMASYQVAAMFGQHGQWADFYPQTYPREPSGSLVWRRFVIWPATAVLKPTEVSLYRPSLNYAIAERTAKAWACHRTQNPRGYIEGVYGNRMAAFRERDVNNERLYLQESFVSNRGNPEDPKVYMLDEMVR